MITKISIICLLALAITVKGQGRSRQHSTIAHRGPSDDELISPCIQSKLKLAQPVQFGAFKTDESLKRLQPALRLSARLCSEKFDEMTGFLFSKLTTSSERSESTANLDSHTVDCYRWHLVKSQPSNPIVKLLSNADGFDDSDCGGIVQTARENYKKHTPSNNTPEDHACIEKIMDRFLVQRFVAVMILHGSFGEDVVGQERKIFSDSLREMSDEVVECFVG